jgi:hypothetical protein
VRGSADVYELAPALFDAPPRIRRIHFRNNLRGFSLHAANLLAAFPSNLQDESHF